VREPVLVLPHPHMAERAFVLAPLVDVAPDLVVRGKSVRMLYAAIDTAGIRVLD
jgi:2-amino-4-hydroxy-6-hydroxymethyldihydropteridine diphosphokinase